MDVGDKAHAALCGYLLCWQTGIRDPVSLLVSLSDGFYFMFSACNGDVQVDYRQSLLVLG